MGEHPADPDMRALRVIQEIAEDGCLHIRVPAGMGRRFELIILPLNEEDRDELLDCMKVQEESGFMKSEIASPEEDVWNDV
ncbi:hypothetical protein [Geobacter sp.]|uniref:hypothetical protein n=1 Tax=Geobacter sp. TaxID=46610 RepID=UPI00262039DE|nr:hypothetical protein [Geobacter sp.]